MHPRLLAASALLLATLAGCVYSPCAGGLEAHATADHHVAISWGAVANATAYLLVRSVDDGAPQPYAELPPATTTYLDTNVTIGHTYSYSVATATDATLDTCPPVRVPLADASVPFFGSSGLVIAAAGAMLGALMVLLRRRP